MTGKRPNAKLARRHTRQGDGWVILPASTAPERGRLAAPRTLEDARTEQEGSI